MAILTGNNGVLKLDATVGGSVATIAAVRNFSIELTSDTIETSTMGVDVRTYVKGMSTWSGNADIIHDLRHAIAGFEARALIRRVEKEGLAIERLPLAEDGHLLLPSISGDL